MPHPLDTVDDDFISLPNTYLDLLSILEPLVLIRIVPSEVDPQTPIIEKLSAMERKIYGSLIGAILSAGAFAVALQMNAAVGQTGEGVLPSGNETGNQGGNASAAGNFTITEEGLGNGTLPASIPTPVDTGQLKMHIEEANSAVQANDTQAAMNYIVLALEEIESILGSNATSTANATDTTMGNATMMNNDTAMNNTLMP